MGQSQGAGEAEALAIMRLLHAMDGRSERKLVLDALGHLEPADGAS